MQNARHVVVVMNGTARWAEQHRRTLAEAQQQSLITAQVITRAASAAKVRYLTFCGEHAELPSYPIRPSSPALPARPRSTDAAPDGGTWLGRELGLASEDPLVTLRLGQSGRRDIASAVRKLAQAVQAGRMEPNQLDESLLRATLLTAELPDPDLIVYSGCPAGEHRLRDELIFESAYAEFFFCERLWPDLAAADFVHALSDFASRQRRFGKTAEQLASSDPAPSRYAVASSSIGS